MAKRWLAGWLLAMACAAPAHAQTVEYIHTDALGTPVAVTDANGSVIERSEYEPYGALLNKPITDGPGYTGHVMDAATGLVYMQQRYYDPIVGRFLSVDPVTADANTGANFNRYKYAANNPFRFTDPDGRLEWDQVVASWNWLNSSYQRDAINNCFPHGCSGSQEMQMRTSDQNRQRVNSVLVAIGGVEAPVQNAKMATVFLGAAAKSSTAKYICCAVLAHGADMSKIPGPGEKLAASLADEVATHLADKAETTARIAQRLTKEMPGIRPPSGAGGATQSTDGFKGTFRVEGRIDAHRLDKN